MSQQWSGNKQKGKKKSTESKTNLEETGRTDLVENTARNTDDGNEERGRKWRGGEWWKKMTRKGDEAAESQCVHGWNLQRRNTK